MGIVTVIPLLSPLAHPPSGQPQGVRIGIGIFNCSSTSPATTYPRCVVYRRRNPISMGKMSGMKRHLEWYTQQRDQPLKDRTRFLTWNMRGLHGIPINHHYHNKINYIFIKDDFIKQKTLTI